MDMMCLRIMKSAFVFALMMCFHNILFSQINDTVITFTPVEITAEKLLKEKVLDKIVLDSTVLQNYFNHSLSEVLSNNSCVFVKTYGQGSLATVSMRGTAASHTQVEWNGMNINSPMLGQVDFSQIPIWFLDQVEVLSGSSSLQSGSGAIGGNVNITNIPGFNRKLYGSFVQSVGSFESYQSFVQIGGGNSKLQGKLRAYYDVSENNFEYYNNANGLWNYEKQLNAGYEKKGFLSEVFYNHKNNSMALAFWFHKSKRDLPPIMSYQGLGRKEQQFDEDIRLSFNWKHFFKRGFSDLSSGFSLNSLEYYLANETNLGTYINYHTSSNSAYGFIKYILEVSLNKKLFFRWNNNVDYSNAVYQDLKTEQTFNANRISAGSSVTVFYQFHHNMTSYLLVRGEFIDDHFLPLIPSVGLEITDLLIKNLSFKTNFSRNYHQPTLNDLYWNPGGNPLLKPEQGYSGDMGISYFLIKDSLFKLNLSTTAFASLINDWIIWQPSEFRYWTATNMQEVFARGIESKIDAVLKIYGLKFQLSVNYSLTRTADKVTDLNGNSSYTNQLIYIPIHKGNAMLNVFYRTLSMNYSTNYTGKRFTNTISDEVQSSLPAFVLHNVGVKKTFEFKKHTFEMEARVNNLFNKEYQAILWRAMSGRNYQFSVKLSF